VRQLLLAALGAAGSLLMELPALAQISNTTSTFSGDVAAACDFNLPENIPLNYASSANMLDTYFNRFFLTANIPLARIHVSRAVVLAEPPPYASSIILIIAIDDVGGGNSVQAGKDNDGTFTFPVSTSSQNNFDLRAFVYTSGRTENKFELPRGNYSYRTTISCLQ